MRLVISLTLALLTVVATACGGGSATPTSGLDPSPTAGRMLRVSVTDAPFPINLVREASVEISDVQVRDQDGGGWVSLPLVGDDVTVNLVELTGGITEQIVNFEIGPGTYDEVRLIVGLGRVVLEDEAYVADATREQEDGSWLFTVADGGVKFPSGPQTGIKVKIDPPIVVTDQLSGDLILDFELAKNFVFNGPATHAPGVRRVLFTPVVKAQNNSVNGSVSFLVQSSADDAPVPGAEVRLLQGETVAHTAYTDENGAVVLSTLPGTYTPTADAFGFVSASIADVEVVLANLRDGGVFSLDPSTDEIVGTVYDGRGTADTSDDVVLADVAIEVAIHMETEVRATATTNESGAYSLSPLDPDVTYDLTFAKEGYAVHTVLDESSRAAGAGDPLDAVLTPLARSVTLTVQDGSANPLSGITVTITDAWGTVVGTPSTDSGGQATLSLPTGDYTFAWNDGTADRTQMETVVGDATTSAYAITLTP